MSSTLDTLKSLVPIGVVAAGLIGTGYVTLDRQASMAQDIDDISESVDENEEAIEAIQRQLIERQGQVELRTQRIEIEQQQQGKDLDQILLLLQQLQRNGQ